MKWSRDLTVAKRSMKTALRAVSANLATPLKAPLALAKGLELPQLKPFGHAFAPSSMTEPSKEIADFGSNPGRLRMLVHTPQGGVPAHAPLVVVLHGCGQGATAFAEGTGWTALAEELGFSLLMPEQNGRNNQGRCFQWFQPTHTARGEGEAMSIRQMVGTAVERFAADPKRVFVVGLSAGGAMTAALLAAYPDVFAAGAVVAGLPVGAASGATQGLLRMARPGPQREPAAWATQVRDAGPADYRGRWPRVSIWHGTADTVVDPGNADLLATQWGGVHGLHPAPGTDISEPIARHRSWSKAGETLMEQWTVAGMAHGYPIDAKMGAVGPYIVDADIPATRHIARFFGLL